MLPRSLPDRIDIHLELIQLLVFSFTVFVMLYTGSAIQHLRERSKKHYADLQQAHEINKLLATTDELTGLYNRRYLYQSLTDQIEHAKTNGSDISVIFMDLDRFKTVVDTYGHLNGSRTIKEVAETIRETLEEPAYAVAYAGDEFVVVLPSFDLSQAIEQAKKIQVRIKNKVFLRDQGLELHIQSSFGIATCPDDAPDRTGPLGHS